MAYEKHTWECGEEITADKLNNLEDGIEEALDCCGYECTTVETDIYEGTVASTQSYNGAYRSDVVIQDADLQADSIHVVFNDVEYQVQKGTFYSFTYYGAPFQGGFSPSAFATYPFSVYSDGNGYRVAVAASSTNNIAISTIESAVDTDECFELAVKKFVPQNVKDYGTTSVIECDVESNTASGNASHAEGSRTAASGNNSHAEGWATTASGGASHAEGTDTTASGGASHAEGNRTTASGINSHAEGVDTAASGDASHAEGNSTTASGGASHAEGWATTASGDASHAEGTGTIAQGKSQMAIGEYNIGQGTEDRRVASDYAFIIGNGIGGNSRSTCFAIRWDGAIVLADGTILTVAQLAKVANLT